MKGYGELVINRNGGWYPEPDNKKEVNLNLTVIHGCMEGQNDEKIRIMEPCRGQTNVKKGNRTKKFEIE